MQFLILTFLGVCLLAATAQAGTSARDFTPASDAAVIEQLPPRVRGVASNPDSAADTAQQQITLARQTADPRYLGRAQTTLAAWWNKPDAPVRLAILQATVEQSRHEFNAARNTLENALRRDPRQPQGWLTLATLERVSARYAAAQAACQQVAQNGAVLHAAACMLETGSLQGQVDAARNGLNALLRQAGDAPQRAWLLSLLAESEERAGRTAQAAFAYQASLALDGDGYTALAYGDLLLRQGQAMAALQALGKQPASDAVLLRRAYALKLQGDAGWSAQWAQLQERFAALQTRGDDPSLHGRELALAALWLEANPGKAWPLALGNLELQKEPLDWWLALEAAEQAGRPDDLRRLRTQLASAGLVDARLARWQSGKPH